MGVRLSRLVVPAPPAGPPVGGRAVSGCPCGKDHAAKDARPTDTFTRSTTNGWGGTWVEMATNPAVAVPLVPQVQDHKRVTEPERETA